MIEIKNRFSGVVIYKSNTATTLREAISEAVRSRADLADADLADANLARADLAGANLADAYLAGADLADANLADAYLAGADLAGAYLADAYLAGADLAGADLADAKNVPSSATTVDPPEPYVRATDAADYASRAERYRARHPEIPVVPQLDLKILNILDSGEGKLNMSEWHTCETTHCRAGWAITLAGKAGKQLEEQYGPRHAGAMIYRASTGRAPHFFASNEAAMEDIRARAKEQQ